MYSNWIGRGLLLWQVGLTANVKLHFCTFDWGGGRINFNDYKSCITGCSEPMGAQRYHQLLSSLVLSTFLSDQTNIPPSRREPNTTVGQNDAKMKAYFLKIFLGGPPDHHSLGCKLPSMTPFFDKRHITKQCAAAYSNYKTLPSPKLAHNPFIIWLAPWVH